MAAERIETYKGWTIRSKRVGVQGAYGGMAWPGNEDNEMHTTLDCVEIIGHIRGKGAQQRVIDRLKTKIDTKPPDLQFKEPPAKAT